MGFNFQRFLWHFKLFYGQIFGIKYLVKGLCFPKGFGKWRAICRVRPESLSGHWTFCVRTKREKDKAVLQLAKREFLFDTYTYIRFMLVVIK